MCNFATANKPLILSLSKDEADERYRGGAYRHFTPAGKPFLSKRQSAKAKR